MLKKKPLYSLAALLLLTSLGAYAFFDGVSGVLKEPLPWIFLGFFAAVPLILALAIGRMYATARLPKDVSWLWVVFFGSCAFVCSNIIVLAARQSTMQYGTVMTTLDLLGFDVSYNYNEAVRLEIWAMQMSLVVAVILLFFVPAYAYSDKRRKDRIES